MEKECAIIILLYKAVNNEDEHNNTMKSHSGIMPLNTGFPTKRVI